MLNFVAKWKVWYAKRQLALALKEEERLREEAKRLKQKIIPRLEDALEKAEVDLHLSQFFGDY